MKALACLIVLVSGLHVKINHEAVLDAAVVSLKSDAALI